MRRIHPLMVKETKDELESVDSFVAADLMGLSAVENTEIRREIRGAGGRVKVVKNSVARKSFEELGRANAQEILKGSTALAWGEGDSIVDVCKILSDWKKKTKKVGLQGGWMEGRVLSVEDVQDLAAIPGRDQLNAQVVGGIASPLTKLVGSLNGLITGLTVVVKKISERRTEDGGE